MQLYGISLHLDFELRLLVIDVLYLGFALGDFLSAPPDQLLKMVLFLPHFVLLALDLLQFNLLRVVSILVSLLLFAYHLVHLDLLVFQVFYLCLGPVQVHLDFAGLLMIVIDLRRMVLERSSEEELSVTDATAPAHPTLLLNVTERQVFHGLNALLLIGEDPKLVGALLACLFAAEIASVLVCSPQLLVADNAEEQLSAS